MLPRSFNDAQQIADKFKDSVPVILNLQSADNELSKRLIDFASGLTYALNGSMQRVADKVFLLTPRNVEVSAEERARMLDKGGFFNQAYAAPAPQGTTPACDECPAVGPADTVLLLADTASSVQRFVSVFFDVYILLILAYVLTSWIRMPYRSIGCSGFSTTSASRTSACFAASCHRSGRSTCHRSSLHYAFSSGACWSTDRAPA